jgi:hypothetical protein
MFLNILFDPAYPQANVIACGTMYNQKANPANHSNSASTQNAKPEKLRWHAKPAHNNKQIS